jgi:hypothetical protein
MLSRPQKARVLQRYGKLLISAVPDDTTALLMDLCLPPADSSPLRGSTPSDESYVASVADFAQLYTDRPTRLLYLCEFILFNSMDSPPNEQMLYHTLLELYLAERLVDAEQEGAGATAAEVEPQVSFHAWKQNPEGKQNPYAIPAGIVLILGPAYRSNGAGASSSLIHEATTLVAWWQGLQMD